MTDKQILYKVIQKLKEDGTLPDSFNSFYRYGAFDTDIINYWINNNLIESIIFSHDFAKAFWGKEQHIREEWWIYRENWEHHLEVMVLEEKPLKYLEKFLKD